MAARVRALTVRRLPRRERKTSFPGCHGKNNAGVSVSILKHGHLNCHSLPASISAKGKRILHALASLRLRGKDVCQGCSQVEGQQTRFQRCDPQKMSSHVVDCTRTSYPQAAQACSVQRLQRVGPQPPWAFKRAQR